MTIKKIVTSELLYLLISLLIGFVVMCFVCRTATSLDSFSFKILESYIQMKVERMLLFWVLVTLFIITLTRQIRLKYRSHFTNIILVVTGVRLLYWFNIFIQNFEILKNYFIKKNETVKIPNLDNEIIIFRCLQAFIGVIVIICIAKSIIKIKSQNTSQSLENKLIN